MRNAIFILSLLPFSLRIIIYKEINLFIFFVSIIQIFSGTKKKCGIGKIVQQIKKQQQNKEKESEIENFS